MALKIPSFVRIFAALAGIILVVEGTVVSYFASPVRIEGYGSFTESTVFSWGIHLIVLGFLFIIFVLVKDKIEGMRQRRNIIASFLLLIPYIIAAVVAIEGIIIAKMTGNITWEGLGGIRKFWMGAAGAQLFALGVIKLLAWYYIDTPLKTMGLTKTLGIIALITLAAEGIFVMSIAGNTRIDGFGGITKTTFSNAGIQLVALSLILIFLWDLKGEKIGFRGRKILGPRFFDAVGIFLSIIIASEGIALAVLCGRMNIEGLGGILERTVVASGAQLFALGLFSASMWALRKEMLLRTRFAEVVAITCSIAIAAAGLVVVGLAAPAKVESIGGIAASTVQTAGMQLLVLGVLLVVVWILRNAASDIIAEKPLVLKIATYFIIALAFVVACEALFVVNFASITTIKSIGTMLERTILLGGLALFAVSAIQPLVLATRFVTHDLKPRLIAFGVFLFQILLLPPAILF